ncbi:hypothetical protein FI667_g7560, partial [Globisporangium splendens]
MNKGEIPESITALMTEELDATFSIGDLMAKSYLPDPSTQEIHVLVDLRDQRDEMASAGIPDDNGSTVAWLCEFLQNQHSSDALPLVGELADFIQEDLPVKIGVHQSFLKKWSDGLALERGDPQLLSKMFRTANSAPCMDLTYDLLLGVVNPRKPKGVTESSFHWFWDELIRSVIDIVLSEFGGSARDSNRSSSTGSIHPDFLFVVNSFCVFRGEEKAPGAHIETARRELSVGFKVSLYAIVHSSVSRQVDAVELGSFDLNNLGGRFRLLLAILNISRLLRNIASLCPERARDEYKCLVRTNGVKVHLEPTRVVKIFPDVATFQDAKEHLVRVYAILKGNQVPNVDCLISTDEPTGRMVFIPWAAALEQLAQLEQQYTEEQQQQGSSTNDSGAPTKKVKT